jgi:hypothetical protein
MSSSPQRWQRFSLRTLFLLMSVCCVLLGGWTVYLNTFRLQAQSLAAARRLQGEVTVLPAAGPRWCRWVVSMVLGPDSYVEVVKLDLSRRPVDDAALESLAGLVYLQKLDLDRTEISDASMSAIAAMPELMSLSLRYTNLSDRAAPTLARLTNLQSLSLTGTKLTDSSLADLATLQSLTELYIRWTHISDSGADQLRTLLRHCSIYHHPLATEPEHLALSRQR